MHETHRPQQPGNQPEKFDEEINFGVMGRFGIWLLVGTVVIFVLMWGMYRGLLHQEAKGDAIVSPLVDRNVRTLPPEPHLQVTPHQDLTAFKSEEARRTSTYGWVDEANRIVHVPVDRAMDLMLQGVQPAPSTAGVTMQQTGTQTPAATTPSPAPRPAPGGQH